MDSPASSTAAATAAAAASAADPPSPSPSSPSLSRSSSPDPTNPSPSPTSSPPTTAAAAPTAPAAPSAHRRVPPPCWSTEETIALIDAYQEKWYSLRRGNLRASDWQDVADAVAARGPRRLAAASNPLSSSSSSAKTAVQCRHKVEKLRKRYRAERQRALKRNPKAPPKSSWEFFRKMHAMETGGPPPPQQPAGKGGDGGPGTAGSGPPARRGSAAGPPPSSDNSDDDEDEEGNTNHHRFRQTRPLNGLMMMTSPNGNGHGSSAGGPHGPPPTASGFRFKVPKAVRTKLLSPRGEQQAAMGARHDDGSAPFGALPRHRMPTHGLSAMRSWALDKKNRKRHMRIDDDEGSDRQVGSDGGMGEVADAIRMLGDGFMRMEQLKMDMAMQIHRLRMEAEMKRTQMMLDSNRKILDMMIGGVAGGSSSNKRAKASS